jgi:hypothetical protein
METPGMQIVENPMGRWSRAYRAVLCYLLGKKYHLSGTVQGKTMHTRHPIVVEEGAQILGCTIYSTAPDCAVILMRPPANEPEGPVTHLEDSRVYQLSNKAEAVFRLRQRPRSYEFGPCYFKE